MSTSANDSGSNGGSDSTDLKSLMVFGLAYGVATTIAVKAVDRFTSGRTKEDESKIVNSTAGLRKPNIPAYCEHVMDFYEDCLNGFYNRCNGYNEVIKRCHEAGVASGDSVTVSHPPLDPALLFKSFFGCGSYRKANCKKYLTYLKKTNAVLQ